MRPIPPPRNEDSGVARGPGASQRVSPTVRGMVTAATAVGLLGAVSLLLLVPAVFFLIPLPHDVDAVTLCLPGVGPLQRFRDGLEGQYEELVFIHEKVHAEQCRAFGPARYARQVVTQSGRLALEAPALCAEVAVLSRRGEDHARLVDRTVEALMSGYLERGRVPRRDISAAVDRACATAEAE